MYRMNPKQEFEMISRGNHEEIMAYIAENVLREDKAETALVQRGNHEEIMTYISMIGFGEKAEKALIKRGNHEEIMSYISRNCFFYHKNQVAFVHFTARGY